MSSKVRFSEIERRLAALGARPPAPRPPGPPPPVVVTPPPPLVARTVRPARNDEPPPPPPPDEGLFNEKWLGQRGLLAAGVLLVLLAAGYLLKLAFDRGWSSPACARAGRGVVG